MKNKRGVTLLLAVLVSSIALSVGVGIFSLLFSELEISGSVKDSVSAFYAGDSGLECALYWDFMENKHLLSKSPFATDGSVSPQWFDGTTLQNIICGGGVDESFAGNFGQDTCDFSAGPNCTAELYPEYLDNGIKSCSHIIIEKGDFGAGFSQTRISSNGENRDKCI